MFSFFGNKKHSLLEFTSIINNQTLEGANTGSSMDSYYRDYRHDDESSLGSYSEVDAVVVEVEEAHDEPGVETSLSENYEPDEKENEQLNRNLEQLPLKDLHRLVGIASEEEERFDVQSKPDLPPYKIR
jgi:hypothetical protein